jgi:hypothetical protein
MKNLIQCIYKDKERRLKQWEWKKLLQAEKNIEKSIEVQKLLIVLVGIMAHVPTV